MSKYISIDDFEKVIKNITNRIISKYHNSTDGSKYGIFTLAVTRYKGRVFNRNSIKDLVGFILGTDKPIVKKITYGSVEYPTVKIIITFDVEEIKCKTKRTLDLQKDGYTFDSYEEYLKFITGKYQDIYSVDSKHVQVATNIKEHHVSLASVLVNILLHQRKLKVCGNERQFTNLKLYQKLPSSVKIGVDRLVCPLSFKKEDVSLNSGLDYINIEVEKEKLMKSFCTEYWDDFIWKELSDKLQDEVPE